MPAFIDRTGHVFGRLTVLEQASGGRNRTWKCLCSCGAVTIVQGNNLHKGTSRSCGCLRKEQVIQRLTKHGGAANGERTPTYQSWKSMQKRCNNPNDSHWINYGGRGIKVCDRWNDYAKFLADMGTKPTGASIERVDNDMGYEPGNCVWADVPTQARNKRDTRFVTVCGQRLLIRDACIRYGVPHTSIWTYRFQKRLTLTEAFFDRLDRELTGTN